MVPGLKRRRGAVERDQFGMKPEGPEGLVALRPSQAKTTGRRRTGSDQAAGGRPLAVPAEEPEARSACVNRP